MRLYYAEQTEINSKDSTKEGKIKIIVWLSNHFQDKKSYRNMIKHNILEYLNIESLLLKIRHRNGLVVIMDDR